MIRPLTKDERRLWSQGTEDIIATNARDFVSVEVLAMNRQRYEATLRERDIDVAEYCLQLGAAKEFLAQAQETLQDKDEQIEELALAILNAVAFPNDPEWIEKAHRLARAAYGDGEVTSSREIIEQKDVQIEELTAQIEKLVIACTHLLLSADVVWEQGEQGHDWPEACKEARAAIKEATT